MGNPFNKEIAMHISSIVNYYRERRITPVRNVHGLLTVRGMKLLDGEIREFYRPCIKKLAYYSCVPDKKGDFEKGGGKHYYIKNRILINRGFRKDGKKRYSFISYSGVKGYYRNGLGKVSPSARTMFEEDYTTALTLYKAGFYEKSVEYLGRALHMAEDMNCMPHIEGWTYFSKFACFHKIYEQTARLMYPEFVPPLKKSKELDAKIKTYFSDKRCFSEFNTSKSFYMFELGMFFKDMEKLIASDLYRTETAVAGLLYKFYIDALSDDSWYVCSGMRFKGLPEIRVTENGVTFSGDVLSGVYRVAHRFDGCFTFSPLNDSKGKVIGRKNGEYILSTFNPSDTSQLFTLQKQEEF